MCVKNQQIRKCRSVVFIVITNSDFDHRYSFLCIMKLPQFMIKYNIFSEKEKPGNCFCTRFCDKGYFPYLMKRVARQMSLASISSCFALPKSTKSN